MKPFSPLSRSRSSLVLAGLSLAVAASAQVSLPYATSFEDPSFVSGGLSGQAPLDDAATGYRIIPDSSQGLTAPAIVRTGAQSLRYLNALGENGYNAILSVVPTTEIHVSVWVNVHSSDLSAFGSTINWASDPSQYYGLRLGNDSGGFTSTYVGLNANGLVGGGGTAYNATPPALGSIAASPLNRWVEVRLDADSVTRQASATIDGTTFALPELDFGTGLFTQVSILRAGATGPRAYAFFDDLSVRGAQPVPEPASLAALGLGAAAVLRRRRN